MNKPFLKKGDLVQCDLDGNTYEVLAVKSINELSPVKDVERLGNGIVLRTEDGKNMWVYEWEVTPVSFDKKLY